MEDHSGYLVLLRDGETFGVCCQENGCPIFSYDEAIEETEGVDYMNPDIEYRILCIKDLWYVEVGDE